MRKPRMKKVKVMDGEFKNHTIQGVREQLDIILRAAEDLDLKKIDFKFVVHEKRVIEEDF